MVVFECLGHYENQAKDQSQMDGKTSKRDKSFSHVTFRRDDVFARARDLYNWAIGLDWIWFALVVKVGTGQ